MLSVALESTVALLFLALLHTPRASEVQCCSSVATTESIYMITKMGIEPTNYPCDAGCATLTIQLGYSVSTQTNCIPLHYLSMSASSLPYRNTLDISSLLAQRTFRNCQVTADRDRSYFGLCASKMFLYGRTAGIRTLNWQIKSLL